MTRRTSARPAIVALFATAVAACDGGQAPTASAVPATGSPTAVSTSAVTPGPATAAPTGEPTPAAPMVLEDAGDEVHLPAGIYTSRLFEPTIQFEIGPNWYRRGSGTASVFGLRLGNDLGARLQFRHGIDFLQCGKSDVMENPSAQVAAQAILAMPNLHIAPLFEAPIGDRTGVVFRFTGGGAGITEEQLLSIANEFGCVFSFGAEAYPSGNSGWGPIFLPDSIAQLVLVDVDGELVFALADGAQDPDAFFDLVLEVLEGTTLG